jgi:hypothetical protein
MAVMGEESPAVWAEELRRAGRVVFPVRRKRLVIQRGCFVVLLGLNPAMSFTEWIHAGGQRLALGLCSVVLLLLLIALSTWQLVTQRPTLIVDHNGIRAGRTFLPWTAVGTIGVPHGPKVYMVLPIIPTNVWAKHLPLTQDNVKDLPALASWLTKVLQDHRRPAPN